MEVRTVVRYSTGEEFISIKDLINILSKDELNHYRMGKIQDKVVIEYIEELKERFGKLIK